MDDHLPIDRHGVIVITMPALVAPEEKRIPFIPSRWDIPSVIRHVAVEVLSDQAGSVAGIGEPGCDGVGVFGLIGERFETPVWGLVPIDVGTVRVLARKNGGAAWTAQ